VTTQADSGEVSPRFLTVSNLLSISRAVLIVPFILVILSDVPGRRYWAVGIVLLAALTDRYDGILARKYGQVSRWGMILDPLADKLCVAAVAIVFLVLKMIPAWFVAALLVRDLLIFFGGLTIQRVRGLVLPSNTAGKWAVGFIAATFLLILIDVPAPLISFALFASSLMLVVSLVLYVVRFAQVMGYRKGNHGRP